MYKKLVLFAFLVTLSFAINNVAINTPEQQQWNKLKNGQTWSKVVLKMAELKARTGGAVDDLIDAIQDIIADVQDKIQKAALAFEQRTNEHNTTVTNLNNDIDKAELDISETQTLLETVYYVQREQLNQAIEQLATNILNTQEHMTQETQLREQANALYLERQGEHQDAVEAIDECLELVSGLENQPGTPSLAQVNMAQKSISRVHKKLGTDSDSLLVQVLLQMTAEDFADQDKVGQLVNLLNEVRNNLLASLAREKDDEEKAVIAYDADMATSQASINSMTIEKTENESQLEMCLDTIQNAEQFVQERQLDLAGFQQDLEDENESYENDTNTYNILDAQLKKEESACGQAVELLQGSSMADYITDRVDQEVVIDQAHGEGFRTYDNFETEQGE